MGIYVVDGAGRESSANYFRLGIMRVRLPLATRGTPGGDLLAGAGLRDDYAGDRNRCPVRRRRRYDLALHEFTCGEGGVNSVIDEDQRTGSPALCELRAACARAGATL